MRSRNIKPGFFKNDLLAECDPLARILFSGLWCMADREGRMEYRPKRMKAELLPYDNCNVEKLIAQLLQKSFIIIYEVDGKKYLSIPKFRDHQNPNIKECISTIPAPCKDSESTKEELLIPDSPILIPDSPIPHTPMRGNDEKKNYVIPDWIPKDAWDGFVEMRREIKKPLTGRAIQLAVNKLQDLRASGQDPGKVLDQSTLAKWQGLFEVKTGELNNARSFTSRFQRNPEPVSREPGSQRSDDPEVEAIKAKYRNHGE